MSIILTPSTRLPEPDAYDQWLMIGDGTPTSLDMARKMPDAAPTLERAFDSIREDWARIGKALQAQPTGHLGHMPHCGSFGSDFGIMLAWSAVCRQLANAPQRSLVVCDDPWMFRHLTSNAGVKAGKPPAIWRLRAKYFVRGYLARIKVALSLFRVRIGTQSLRDNIASGDPVILVYGHPNSDAKGHDAYFGDLMQRIPSLKRLLHTDAGLGVVRRLGADHRTASLHAWGQLSALFKVPLQRWRVNSNIESGQWRWLIDRSAAIENSGGGPAMNFWQQHCQRSFLAEMTPPTICWPWENHCWERDLCRASDASKTRTIGYQHTVIGPHQFNYAAETNYDGSASLPDIIACDGPAYLAELAAWGAPSERLQDLGALRFTRRDPAYTSTGAVFVPLSAIRKAAEAQLQAANRFAEAGHTVLVKPHPMYPVTVPERQNLSETDIGLAAQTGLKLVIFASGASGLDAVLAGVPAVRLQVDCLISINVLPSFVNITTTTLENLDAIIAQPLTPINVAWEKILSDPAFDAWNRLLTGAKTPLNTSTTETQARAR